MAKLFPHALAALPSLQRPNPRRRGGTAPSFNTRLRASSAEYKYSSSSSSGTSSSKAAEDQATRRRRLAREPTWNYFEEDKEDEEQEKKMELAEELESMEEEALMTAGADQGRDPLDYNRRAHLFDQSSRVFQALKHRSDQAHH
ncbi:hypothetical protein H6P81_014626 [Aristolochia fimbriata]|uniref:Uncharacterized protein n=1 Tax=Aristolochia fimbriata TaxID=158543 RepID=A0AAV7E4G1_ARIFI|nr:hypothetical protein H6P81_014626 [Aristolochia fimbriata]